MAWSGFCCGKKIKAFWKVFLPLLKPRDVSIFRTKSVLVKLKEGSFHWIKDEELVRTISGYGLTLQDFKK